MQTNHFIFRIWAHICKQITNKSLLINYLQITVCLTNHNQITLNKLLTNHSLSNKSLPNHSFEIVNKSLPNHSEILWIFEEINWLGVYMVRIISAFSSTSIVMTLNAAVLVHRSIRSYCFGHSELFNPSIIIENIFTIILWSASALLVYIIWWRRPWKRSIIKIQSDWIQSMKYNKNHMYRY